MIKDIYDITFDLAGRIRNAREIQISEEITAAMLYAEIELNQEVLRATKEIFKADKSSWQEAVMMLSTDALELALFQKDGKELVGKYFSRCKIKAGEDEKPITGTSAAFFIYRKITALKHMALILQKAPNLNKLYRPGARIKNIEGQMQAINKELSEKIGCYLSKGNPKKLAK
jgi:hypothetical protein